MEKKADAEIESIHRMLSNVEIRDRHGDVPVHGGHVLMQKYLDAKENDPMRNRIIDMGNTN